MSARAATSAEPKPQRDILFTTRGEEDFNRAGQTAQEAVAKLLLDHRTPSDGPGNVPDHPDWHIERAGYNDVLYRWLTPLELERLDYPEGATVALVQRIGDVPVPRESINIPGVAAAIGVVIGLVAAPRHMNLAAHRESYSTFFGTTAQVVATLLVALALEARYASLRNRFFRLTVVYVAVGLVAALVAGSTGLPAWSYRVLLALALGGGAGALASTVLIAFWAKEERAREQAPPPP